MLNKSLVTFSSSQTAAETAVASDQEDPVDLGRIGHTDLVCSVHRTFAVATLVY